MEEAATFTRRPPVLGQGHSVIRATFHGAVPRNFTDGLIAFDDVMLWASHESSVQIVVRDEEGLRPFAIAASLTAFLKNSGARIAFDQRLH